VVKIAENNPLLENVDQYLQAIKNMKYTAFVWPFASVLVRKK
jgi:hypothetical protein